MIYYLAILLISAGAAELVHNNAVGFGVFLALCVVKLALVGPEYDPNG